MAAHKHLLLVKPTFHTFRGEQLLDIAHAFVVVSVLRIHPPVMAQKGIKVKQRVVDVQIRMLSRTLTGLVLRRQ